jgi:hypothetical protein
MDLQSRKLNMIKYLIGLQDEEVFSKIESTIMETKKPREIVRNLKPFSQREFLSRAKQSNNDYQAGKFKTQQQLEKESESW